MGNWVQLPGMVWRGPKCGRKASLECLQYAFDHFFLKDLYYNTSKKLTGKYSDLYVLLFAYKDCTGTYTKHVSANFPGIKHKVKRPLLPMQRKLLLSRTRLTVQ